MRDNPWQTLASKTVYQNAWIRVREDSVIRPDGKPGIYGVVETKKATGVLALTPDCEVVLVGQYRYTTECYSWEMVAGGTEEDEEPLATAKRELQEEAGLIARDWQQLGTEFHLSNCISQERAYLFLAQDLTETISSPEGTEVLELRRVPLFYALEMVRNGEIWDAMTVIALYSLAMWSPQLVEKSRRIKSNWPGVGYSVPKVVTDESVISSVDTIASELPSSSSASSISSEGS